MPRPNPKPIEGARALLFERLVDDQRAPRHSHSNRVLDRADLRESVRREVERLLNARCAVPLDAIRERERTVIDYGIPDFSSLSPRNTHDQRLLAETIAQTINTFEPRLRDARLTIERFEEKEHALYVKIEARLVIGLISEPVCFPALVQTKKGEWRVESCE